jgi:hypothetical protein
LGCPFSGAPFQTGCPQLGWGFWGACFLGHLRMDMVMREGLVRAALWAVVGMVVSYAWCTGVAFGGRHAAMQMVVRSRLLYRSEEA